MALFQNQNLTIIIKEIWKYRNLEEKNIRQKIFVDQKATLDNLNNQYPKFEHFFKKHIRQLILSVKAIDTHTEYELSKTDPKTIGYVDGDQIAWGQYRGYLTTFAYFREYEQGRISEQRLNEIIGINLECGAFSYSLVPNQYSAVLGVSGTLETLHEESKKILSLYIDCGSIIPSMFGISHLNFDQKSKVFVINKIDDFYVKIKELIIGARNQNRPTLVFFQDNESIKRCLNSNQLPISKDEIIIIQQSKENDLATLESKIIKAAREKTVTFLEKSFGRGTDFKCNSDIANNNGGILVIQTFLSEDLSEEVQIKGRTARQSKNGEYYMVLLSDKTIPGNIHDLYPTITQEELEKQNQTHDTLYSYLDSKRKEKWGKKIIALKEQNSKCQFMHDMSVKYQKMLINGKIQDAITQICAFNQNSGQEGQQSFHFIFCLDDSGSMECTDGTKSSRWQKVYEAFQKFILERQNTDTEKKDFISIILFSDSARIIAKQILLKEAQTILNNAKKEFSCTNFKEGVDKIYSILQSQDQASLELKKMILFLTDGGDGMANENNYNQSGLYQSLEKVKKDYTSQISGWWNLGFGAGIDLGLLYKMSDHLKVCGGETKQQLTVLELQKDFEKLALGQKLHSK